jgi:ankyrin repeat protein
MDLSDEDIQNVAALLLDIRSCRLERVKAKSTNRWRDLSAEDLDLVASEQGSEIDVVYESNYSGDGSKTIHTLLSYSVVHSTPEIIQILLTEFDLDPDTPLADFFFDVDDGEDIEVYEASDITPLIIAIRRGLYEIARTLLEHGANTNGVWHALGQASNKNSRSTEDEFFSLLLHHGANLNHAVFEYLSGLSVDTEEFEQALQMEDLLPRIDSALVRFKKVGAGERSIKPGESLAHIGAMHPALLSCLKRHFSLPPVDNEIAPPALLGHICPTTLNILKLSGHDLLKRDIFGNSLLHKWALEMCAAYDWDGLNTELTRSFDQIAANKINIDERNNRKQTPLHLAALYKSSMAIRLLLSRGADPNAKDENGLTPFAYALISNAVESDLDDSDHNYVFSDKIDEEILVVEELMNKGARLDITSSNGISLPELVAVSKPSIFSKVASLANQKYKDIFHSIKNSAASRQIYFYADVNKIIVAGHLYCGDIFVIAKKGLKS